MYFTVVAAGVRTVVYQPYTGNAELARQVIERVTSGPRKQAAFEAESANSAARLGGEMTVEQQRLSNREGFHGDSRGIEPILARVATNMVTAPATAAYEVRGKSRAARDSGAGGRIEFDSRLEDGRVFL